MISVKNNNNNKMVISIQIYTYDYVLELMTLLAEISLLLKLFFISSFLIDLCHVFVYSRGIPYFSFYLVN